MTEKQNVSHKSSPIFFSLINKDKKYVQLLLVLHSMKKERQVKGEVRAQCKLMIMKGDPVPLTPG